MPDHQTDPIPPAPAGEATASTSEPTVNDLLVAGTQAEDAALVRKYQEALQPDIERTKPRIALYRRLAEETAELRRRALAVDTGRLTACGCDPSFVEAFGRARKPVVEIVEALATAEKVLGLIGRLTPSQCLFDGGIREYQGQLPPLVAYYRNALSVVGEGEDIHRVRIAFLRDEMLPRMETFARNFVKRPHPPPATTRKTEPLPDAPVSQHFNPFEYPKR